MQCFMSYDFDWDPVLYTIDRPVNTPGKPDLYAEEPQLVLLGPFQPQVIPGPERKRKKKKSLRH